MTGTFTQTIANLNQASQSIAAISGLPANAAGIQSSIDTTSSALSKSSTGLQSNLKTGAAAVITILNTAAQQISAEKSVAEITATLQPAAAQTKSMQAEATAQVAATEQASSSISTDVSQLVTISSGINSQIAGLRAQLSSAQSEESAAEKKYYILLALGPFGLVGLAAALALYLTWKSNVSDIENQINGINSQIANLTAMNTATNHLSGNSQALVSAVSGLSNASMSLSSDLGEILQDLSKGQNLTVIGLLVQAALKEASTLQIDVS